MSGEPMDVDVDGAEAESLKESGTTKVAKKDKKPKFEIKKWTGVSFWSYDIVAETCSICRNHIMEPCIECHPLSINGTAKECKKAWGTCNHAFHFHCISRWLKTRPVCPLDNKEWNYLKYGN